MTIFGFAQVLALILAGVTFRIFEHTHFMTSPDRSIRCASLAGGSSFLCLIALFASSTSLLLVGVMLIVFFGALSMAAPMDPPKKRKAKTPLKLGSWT